MEYIPVKDVELLGIYEPGGHHPVHIGDSRSENRYSVIHKLGSGGFSTIWLARNHNGTYVAIKIGVASKFDDTTESEILKHPEGQTVGQPEKRRVQHLVDAFVHSGPNGSHRCHVTNPGACSVAESEFYFDGVWLFHLDSARAITAQLIQSIACVHAVGVVHGDLHPGNVLFTKPRLDSLSVQELYAKYGEPKREAVVRLDGKPPTPNAPSYVVPGIWMGKVCEEMTLEDSGVVIADFGESWQTALGPRYHLNTPRPYRAPEGLFAESRDASIGPAADIWSLGCVMYTLFAQRDIFESLRPDNDDVLAEHASMLGKPPSPWWDSWEAKTDFFDETGAWAVERERMAEEVDTGLEKRVMEYISEDRGGDMSTEELGDLLSLLDKMFRWAPEERATAGDLLASTWMRKWGVPAMDKLYSRE